MAEFEITGPDGKKYRVSGENAEGAVAALKKHLGVPAQSPAMTQGLSELSQLTTREGQARLNPQKSFGTRAYETVFGDNDPNTQNAGEAFGTFLNKAGEAMTFGLVGDEAEGALVSALGGDGAARRDYLRKQEEIFRQNHPVATLGAEVGGSVLGAVAAPGVGVAKTALGSIGRAAGVGAVAGGTYGAMEADTGNRLAEGAKGAALGGLFGAGAQTAVNIGTAGFRRLFQKTAERPTVEGLRATKTAAYNAVDNSGEAFTPDDMSGILNGIKSTLDEGGFVGGFNRKADYIVAQMENIVKRGKTVSLSELDKIRQRMWKAFTAASDETELLDVIGVVDDAIEARGASSELMAAARLANSRFKKAEMLDLAFQKARGQSDVYGGGMLVRYKRAVESIIDDPKRAKWFSDAEISAMRSFVQGDIPERVARTIGKLAPSGNGLMMALNVGAVAQNPAMAGLSVAATGAKALSDGSVQRSAEDLIAMVGGGAVKRPAPIQPRGMARSAGILGN